MPVPDEVRDVEREIDAKVESYPLWKHGRAVVLEGLMRIYRDGIELTVIRALLGEVSGEAEKVIAAIRNEQGLRNGTFWALKWATKLCREDGEESPIRDDNLVDAILIGQAYDVLVDVLKHGERDLVELSINRSSHEIICYEGEDLTGFDAEVVQHQQVTGPARFHVSLTDDSDQLTLAWCAGDYRKVVRELASFAEDEADRIVLKPEYAMTVKNEETAISRPTLVWMNQPETPPEVHVFESLTIPREMSDAFMWKARSLLETPIVAVAGRFCALSSDLGAIAVAEEYMLRLAARVDEEQYSKASGLREQRMIRACMEAFEGSNRGWTVRSGVTLKDPPQDADVVASRAGESLVIELKSTLRPESPWEVYKRNEDILKGLRQAGKLVRRNVGDLGLVVTDGYRGDYVCWAEARKRNITIGTLTDLDELAREPERGIRLMTRKAGIPTMRRSDQRLADRKIDLFGWTLRLVDGVSG